MDLTYEEIRKAREISRAIQEYLVSTGQKGARPNDVYQFLARRDLIEKDRHEGIHFNKFLNKLKKTGMLKLIPQCTCTVSNSGRNEWHFYRASEQRAELHDIRKPVEESQKHYSPELSQEEISHLTAKETPLVEKLPQRKNMNFTIQELEIRKNYPRAYELWTDTEIDIMKRVYTLCKNIDATANLLKRQPHVVKEKLESLRIQ